MVEPAGLENASSKMDESAEPRTADAGMPAPVPGKHRIRWLSLSAAGSASIASLVLALELRFGLPLEFVSTLLLAAAAGIGLPLLTVLLAGGRPGAKGWGRMHVWAMASLVFAVLFLVVLLF